jgi:hypothetical protein
MVSLQRTIGRDFLIEGDYYGIHASNLLLFTDVNRFPGDLIVNNGTLKRLNPYFGSVQYSYDAGISDSDYASFMVSKRYSRSWSLTGIFTFGKATDDNSSFGTGAVNAGNIVNALNPASQHGLADFSVAKRLSVDGTFTVPNLWNGGIRSKLLAGWRLQEIGILQSGLPFSVYCSAPFNPVYQVPGNSSTPIVANTGCDYNADGFAYDFPNTPAFGNHISAGRGAFLRGLFTASQFPAPPLGQEGNLGRNTFNGPGLANFNTEFAKATKIPWFTAEGASFEFRADVFNLFNRVNLGFARKRSFKLAFWSLHLAGAGSHSAVRGLYQVLIQSEAFSMPLAEPLIFEHAGNRANDQIVNNTPYRIRRCPCFRRVSRHPLPRCMSIHRLDLRGP